ncbi:hypothetical protein QFC21_002898 [Naganishia friedmannii]|uniref:Uncharacterized protein n=1 Tax=Naganishia friedmannii TaxID=89922 RepID=A0ACC2VTQ3_9TREE|nr:hypothetical protein QFC21_002898 [Naganishia friedmannii]
MAPLTHPSIVDGWFREINSQWPGQALTLKVNKILHMEKSQYQDVLVFESETYGNVLILDGVVQCTERDEFSYQEMITHLPMASHPNPKHVLVIGGGDGGVVREVLKHKSVEHVTLCDIDEAVVRVSKQFLPHMASVLTDDRVTVFIGDGFKFLPEHENEYDVIITDSSDPVGPAASLFEAPFFTLLKKSLKEGGNMSTQGESLWLHLPLIKELRETTKRLFPVAEYAFTTIPTYPSGSIGFVCCSLDPKRSVSEPLRPVPDCMYYNNDVHRAAFVLPEFGRAMVQEGRQLQQDFTGVRPGAKPEGNDKGKLTTEKKVLLLGSGFVAQPAAEYITRHGYGLTVAARSLESAQELANKVINARAIDIDVADAKALDAAVADHDLVVSLIPYTFHAAVIESAIRNKKHVVTTSYVSPAMKELDEKCKQAGIIVFNEIGLDPGLDHVAAVDIIDRVHKQGGKINKFESFCGGLVAAENANNALGYKLSWSARGVLLALRNTAKYLQDGKEVVVEGKDLMSVAKPYYGLPPAYNLQCYPNRDSTPFREFYNIPEAQTVVRGTLRYGDFASVVKCWVELGLLDDSPKEWLANDQQETTWAKVMAQALGLGESTTSAIVEKFKTLTSFQGDKQQILIQKFKQLGLVSESKKAFPRGNLLDTLCATLEQDLAMQEGERDLVLLQHKFEVTRADGQVETITSTLEELGAPTGSGRPSAMAKLVGVPCGIAVDLVLTGKVGKPGVQAPYDPATCQVFLKAFEEEGIVMTEETF